MTSVLGKYTINQVSTVVRDLESAMDEYMRLAGIGPWNVYTNSAPPLQCFYQGHPANYKVRVAIARSDQVHMELIQYLEGESIHRDFLASGRVGIEHVGVFVPDLALALAPYQDQGIAILQQGAGLGLSRDGCYAYLDTEKLIGTVLELIQPASQASIPELIYPMLSQPNPQEN
jgi:methylmalonyl-CoA/ethylmalonyl-CoA epimerase